MTQWDEDRKIIEGYWDGSIRDADFGVAARERWPAALERIAELETGLRDIALWCEEGWEPVSVWPAERARHLLSQDKPNG